MSRTIADVQTDIAKLQALWGTAVQQYEARKASLSTEVDGYIATHQNAANSHSAEIKAATALKAVLVPAAAGVETAGTDLNSFLLTMPWYQRFVAFLGRNWRWVVYGCGLIGIVWVAVHLHK